MLGAPSDEYSLYFTSGGTESNNWALRSLAKAGKENGKTKIISTSIEHPSVYNTLMDLKRDGFDIVMVKPDSTGILNPHDIVSEIDDKTILVSVMTVNNIIGTIQPVEEIGKICRDRGVIFHTDCVQGVGQIPISMSETNIDMLSASAHKFGGMKGVGFLICKDDINLKPMITGGKQNGNKRAGTENVLGIATTESALSQSLHRLDEKMDYVTHLRTKILYGLSDVCKLNGSLEHRVPNNINISLDMGISGAELAVLLESDDIIVSTTSACETGSKSLDRTLLECGFEEDRINKSIRVTTSANTTIGDCNKFIEAVRKYAK